MADFDRDEWRRTMKERRDEWRQMRREHRDEWRQSMRAWRGPHSGSGGLIVGFVLAGIGVLLLLQNLGILYVDDLWQYWPMILIVLGVSKAATGYGFASRIWGGAMVIAGAIFLLHNLNIIHGDVWNFIWPVILIFVGVGMLGRHLDGPHPFWRGTAAVPPIASDESTASRLNVSTVFSGVERRIETQDFEGGELHAVFGGIDIDLSRAGTKKDQIVIEANAVFGGVNLRVPDSWNVTVRGTGVFGGYEDKTIPPRSADPKAPHLTVTGGAVFGGVTVRN